MNAQRTGARARTSTLASAVVLVLFLALAYSKLKKEGPWVGKPAPEFSLPLVYGEGSEKGDRIRLSDLKGQLVLLDFWAGWCEPCRQSVPHLNQVAALLKDQGVQMFGINSESLSSKRVAQVAQAWGFAYPVLHDITAETLLGYDVEVLPTLFLIDEQGRVQKTHGGSPTVEQLVEEVRALKR